MISIDLQWAQENAGSNFVEKILIAWMDGAKHWAAIYADYLADTVNAEQRSGEKP